MDGRTRFLPDRLNYAPALRCLVDAHTILFGSRNPRDYDIAPGTCGKVDEGGRGCKPLISSKRVANEAIMGDGIIDGRGWVKLTGQGQLCMKLDGKHRHCLDYFANAARHRDAPDVSCQSWTVGIACLRGNALNVVL